MADDTKISTMKALFFSGVLAIASGYLIMFLATEDLPEIRNLAKAEGTLRFVKRVDHQHYGSDVIMFGLTGMDEEFHYNSRSGALDKVYTALENAEKHSIAVLFTPKEPHSAIFDKPVFFTAYALSINEHSIRSFLDVKESRESYNRLVAWAGTTSVIFGILLLVRAFFHPLLNLPIHDHINNDYS